MCEETTTNKCSGGRRRVFVRWIWVQFWPVSTRAHAFVFAEDAGVNPRESAHAALVTRTKSSVLELQLVVA